MAVVSLVLLALAGRALADPVVPAALVGVGIEQKLDQPLPLELSFRDESGKTVRLGDLFSAKPVLLTFAYYHCPMLCPMALESLVRTVRPLTWNVGDEFEIVTVSIDARETPAMAADMKQKMLAAYGRPEAARGWHFLVGDEAAIRRFTEAVGFRYRYEAASDQFAHATGVVVATPEGRISRVLYGIDHPPRDLRLALVEASEHRIGTLADQLLLFCFHYDPATGKYGAATMNAVRLGGALTFVGLVAFVVGQLRGERRARP